MRIVIFVDLVLGPALTFIIFNPAKSRRALWFDFTMIGIVQASAFVWGIYAVHGQRPVAIAYMTGAFYSFEEKPLLRQGHTAADLASIDSRAPALLYTDIPKTKEGQEAMVEAMRRDEVAPYEMFDHLQPLKPHIDELWVRSDALAQLLWADPAQAAALEKILKRHPTLKRDDLRFVWFIGRYEDATLVMTTEGDVLGSVAFVQPKNDKKPERRSEAATQHAAI